jgi:AcrR family transcriptional regulator
MLRPSREELAFHLRNGYVACVDEELHRATVSVLAELGWDGLTLERVAERAGRSRVTLWRNGVTRDSLVAGLLRQLSEDYRDAMLPVLTAGGTSRERLERTMQALCDVVDAHADLLAISDDMFHRAYEAGDVPIGFLDPFVRVLADARASGQLRGEARDTDLADVLFNGVAWPYLHLRARHRWPAARARRLLFAALLDGVLR